MAFNPTTLTNWFSPSCLLCGVARRRSIPLRRRQVPPGSISRWLSPQSGPLLPNTVCFGKKMCCDDCKQSQSHVIVVLRMQWRTQNWVERWTIWSISLMLPLTELPFSGQSPGSVQGRISQGLLRKWSNHCFAFNKESLESKTIRIHPGFIPAQDFRLVQCIYRLGFLQFCVEPDPRDAVCNQWASFPWRLHSLPICRGNRSSSSAAVLCFGQLVSENKLSSGHCSVYGSESPSGGHWCWCQRSFGPQFPLQRQALCSSTTTLLLGLMYIFFRVANCFHPILMWFQHGQEKRSFLFVYLLCFVTPGSVGLYLSGWVLLYKHPNCIYI